MNALVLPFVLMSYWQLVWLKLGIDAAEMVFAETLHNHQYYQGR